MSDQEHREQYKAQAAELDKLGRDYTESEQEKARLSMIVTSQAAELARVKSELHTVRHAADVDARKGEAQCDALQQQVAQLQEQLAQWKDNYGTMYALAKELKAERDALKEQRDREAYKDWRMS